LLEDVLLHHELVISGFILEELGRKLVEKFNFPRRDADQVDAFLRRVSIVVEPADPPPDLCRDPTDLPVLGTAVSGACALLISVDRDLLDMQTVQSILIIRPGQYWRRTAENG
jgi:predicted nucleic acid-binding protein